MKKFLSILSLSIVLFFGGCKSQKPEVSVVGLEVETVRPRMGEISDSFVEPAMSRLSESYLITMPVDGRIGRIEREPGSAVKAGEKLIEIDLVPFEEMVAEARAAVGELEAQIRVNEHESMEQAIMTAGHKAIAAAEEAMKSADAQVVAEKVRYERAAKDVAHYQELAHTNVLPEGRLEDYEIKAENLAIGLRKQEFQRAAIGAIYEAYKLIPELTDGWIGAKHLEREALAQKLLQAKSRLSRAEHELKIAEIRSPIDGIVLERHERGDGFLPAGRPLLLLGNMKDLEGESDIPTNYATRISPGSQVLLDIYSQEKPVTGRVVRIEPVGFKKVTQGAEEMRVKVIFSLDVKPEKIGVNYGFLARFYTGGKSTPLIIPERSVLQATDGSHYVFKIVGDKLKRQPVEINRGEKEMGVTSGLTQDDLVVVVPDAAMKEGVKVRVKK